MDAIVLYLDRPESREYTGDRRTGMVVSVSNPRTQNAKAKNTGSSRPIWAIEQNSVSKPEIIQNT